MLKLTINKDKAPEFEADIEDFEEIKDFSKSCWQVIVEIIKNITNEAWYTNEQKYMAVINLLKNSWQIAYFKMKQLWWVGSVTMDEMIDTTTTDGKAKKAKKTK